MTLIQCAVIFLMYVMVRDMQRSYFWIENDMIKNGQLVADAHLRYRGYVNTHRRVTGHLWQGRFEGFLGHSIQL